MLESKLPRLAEFGKREPVASVHWLRSIVDCELDILLRKQLLTLPCWSSAWSRINWQWERSSGGLVQAELERVARTVLIKFVSWSGSPWKIPNIFNIKFHLRFVENLILLTRQEMRMSRVPRLWASCLHWARGAATATVKVVSSDIMRTTALIKEEPKSLLPAVYCKTCSYSSELTILAR